MMTAAGGDSPSSTDSFRPRARTSGLLESGVGDELVLYDVEHDRAHALNAPALALWRACDGTADV
ncbi:MAG: PqqD family protein, partial [Actinomycetota bacterium]|nr:PqqD family protein [Actinomycetota bacterium]